MSMKKSLFERFASALNREEAEIVQGRLKANADRWQELSEESLVETLVGLTLWDYKSVEESYDIERAVRASKRKAKLYAEWKKLGVVS